MVWWRRSAWEIKEKIKHSSRVRNFRDSFISIKRWTHKKYIYPVFYNYCLGSMDWISSWSNKSDPRALQEILATVTTLVFTHNHYNWNPISVVPPLLLLFLPNDILCGHITRCNKFETSCIRCCTPIYPSFAGTPPSTALMIPPPPISALAHRLPWQGNQNTSGTDAD